MENTKNHITKKPTSKEPPAHGPENSLPADDTPDGGLKWCRTENYLIATRQETPTDEIPFIGPDEGKQVENIDSPGCRCIVLTVRRLLSAGGIVVFVSRVSSALEHLMCTASGTISDGRKVKIIPGNPNRSHHNVAAAHRKDPNNFRIAQGFALSEDELAWIEHSWLVDKTDQITETTMAHLLYYGMILSDDQANDFVRRVSQMR